MKQRKTPLSCAILVSIGLVANVFAAHGPSLADGADLGADKGAGKDAGAAIEASDNRVCKGVSVQVLGSGGPELDDGRTSSGYLVWVNDTARVIVDAGSGSSIQFGASGAQFEDIDALLLSHLHTDHASDLSSYIKGSYFTSRQDNLMIFGPAGNDVMPATSTYVDTLLGDEGAFRYLSSYTQVGEDDYTIVATDVTGATASEPLFVTIAPDITAKALSVPHGPIPTLAWKVIANGCSIVFSGDTNDANNALSAFAENADLLILHNAIPDNAGNAAKSLHMTPTQLIRIAKDSKAKQVLVSHIMRRSEVGLDALIEAMTVVAPGRVYAAKELMNITLE